jgi:hypothetical protein
MLTRLGNARESRAPRRDCHGLNGRWRKSPRCLFDLPESRSSSGWPKEDTENTHLGARPELTRSAEPEAASFRRAVGPRALLLQAPTAATAIDV